MAELRPLDLVERRIVGALLEKELSTPDQYPLTLNALLAACNQSSNRDPVLALGADEVQAALERLMGLLLAWRERGARTLRWKHLVDEKLRLDRPGKALLAELLLRGPQTPGELRGRSGRMHAMHGLGEVEAVLTELAAAGLVEELARQPGQKERRWRELLGGGLTKAGARTGALVESDAESATPEGGSTRSLADRVRDAERAAAQRVETRAEARAAASAREAGLREPADAAPPTPTDLRQRLDVLERHVAELTRRLAELEAAAKVPTG